VKNNTNTRLETLAEDLPHSGETLQKGLKILARIIAKNILSKAGKHKREKSTGVSP